MDDTVPRYEFRAFAQSFGLVIDRIRRLSACDEIRESREQYLVADHETDLNIKLRNRALEVKALVDRYEYLERWRPTDSKPFPVSRAFVEQLLTSPDRPAPGLQRDTYTPGQLLDEVVRPSPIWWTASVFKRRFRFVVGGCPAEFDELLVNGAAIRSVAAESEDAAALQAALKTIGLIDYENVSYPRAIRRILGLEPWPEEPVGG